MLFFNINHLVAPSGQMIDVKEQHFLEKLGQDLELKNVVL